MKKRRSTKNRYWCEYCDRTFEHYLDYKDHLHKEDKDFKKEESKSKNE